MPPKRKGKAAAATPAKKTKKVQEPEPEPESDTIKDKIAKLKEADKGKVKKFKVDPNFPFASSAEVYQDYDAMLNQTNIGHNNNKFYIIQVAKNASGYYTWNRWGRVGENGQNKLEGPFPTEQPAIKSFEKKFRDKTRNKWEERDSFKAVSGKYTLLEMAGEEEDEEEMETVQAATVVASPSAPVKTAACTLEKNTQSLMKLIFDNDMFKETLQKFDIDVKKMPLGKLSKSQIAKGFEALEVLEMAIEKGQRAKFNELTSKFYTIIPHSFGRTVPPALSTIEDVQRKYDMLAVLGDIEIAQSMQKAQVKAGASGGLAPHPLDANYKLLDCTLEPMSQTSQEYKVLQKNFDSTKCGGYRDLKLNNIWKVDRRSQAERFAANDKIAYRKLLWHGTSVAVVSAILKTGLRIMPHSGGRVGKGIYFASENEKSAGYVGPAQGKVIMFLTEVALGKQHKILRDDSSLKKAPPGFDSVLACGRQEPDEKQDTTLKIEGKTVIVPQGKATKIPEHSSSSFHNSEYLVYREDQARIRYMLLFNC